MVTVRLFAQARETAGESAVSIDAVTVAQAIDVVCSKFGDDFGVIVNSSKVWLNGSPTQPTAKLRETDELAILPPVSGG